MKTLSRYLVFLLIVLTGISCSHKRYTKKAAEFESQGMYQEATDWYYQALIAKRDYLEAQMGLKRTGQRVIDKTYGDFMSAYNQGNNKQAVYFFLEAEKFEKKLADMDIQLVVPPYYEEYYNEVKSTYLDDQYFSGVKKLNDEDFSGAEKIFREIVTIDAAYKDSKEKLNISIYEPKHRQASNYMGNKKYRTAYYIFEDIIKNYGNYKESVDLKNECQEKATIRIAVQDIKNHSSKPELSSQIKSKIISGLNSSNDPFIKIVEMPKTSTSRLSTSGVSRESTLTKSIQPDAIVKGTIHSFTYDMGRLQKEDKRGYLEVKTQYKDSEGNTKTKTSYDKVSYQEFKMQRSVIMKFDVTMVDTRTSEILMTKSFNLTNKDAIHYAKYEGKKSALIPGYWKNKNTNSDEDVISNSRSERRELQELLKSRQKIKTFEALSSELLDEVTSNTVDNIVKYNPE